MLRVALAVGLCLTVACGKDTATAPVAADPAQKAQTPASGPDVPKPGEDLQVWFVGWFERLAAVSETATDCGDIAARWDAMAEAARPHFAKIKEIEAGQTAEQKQAWADKHIGRLKPAQLKVESAIVRCKDDAAFQQTMQKVLSLL